MSRSNPSRVSKPRGKKGKGVRKVNRSDYLEPKVSKGRDLIAEGADELLDEAIVLEPRAQFNKAIVGIASTGVLVYSARLCVQSFIDEGMTDEEALEYFQYNTLRAMDYVPQETRPIFITSERDA